MRIRAFTLSGWTFPCRGPAGRSVVWAPVFFLASLFAVSNAAANPKPEDAQQLMSSTAERMLSKLEQEGDALRNNPQWVRKMVDQNLLPHVDFDQMSRLVLGKHWRTATTEQRASFIEEFRQFLVRFYTAALIEYSKGHDIPKDVIRFLPLRAAGNDTRVTVRSEVKQPGSGQYIPVDYQLSSRDEQWKVYDVSVDGISLVANYRSSFAVEIRNGGVDGLIKRLAQRNEELQ